MFSADRMDVLPGDRRENEGPVLFVDFNLDACSFFDSQSRTNSGGNDNLAFCCRDGFHT